jgi:hypothetical protein
MCGDPTLHVFDIHIDEQFQRKGLGKHLLVILELIARKEKMKTVSIPVMLGDMMTEAWLKASGRGFSIDKSMDLLGFDAEMEVCCGLFSCLQC